MPSGIERSRCTQNWVDEVRTELGRAEGSTEHLGLLGALSGPVRDEGMLDSQVEWGVICKLSLQTRSGEWALTLCDTPGTLHISTQTTKARLPGSLACVGAVLYSGPWNEKRDTGKETL